MRKVVALSIALMAVVVGCKDESLSGGSTASTQPSDGFTLDGVYVSRGGAAAWLFSAQGEYAFSTLDRFGGLVDGLTFETATSRGTWHINEGGWSFTLSSATGDLWGSFQGENHTKHYIKLKYSDGAAPEFFPLTKLEGSPAGSYKRTTRTPYGTDNTGHVDGVVNGDHYIKFRAGTVEVLDSVGVFINGEYLLNETRISGDYTIDGYTLEIAEFNGKTSRHNLWLVDGSPSDPTVFAYDGTSYIR